MSSRRRRLAVVSLHAHRPLAPRGERTRRLVERLERDWEVELIAPPASMSTGGASGRSGGSNPARKLAAAAVDRVLLDKWEPWSMKRLGRWKPQADAALLIGHPVAPVVYAGRRLEAAGVPYVVDEGDPWILTNPSPYSKGLSLRRGRRAERRLWASAAGAVLTTPQQTDRLTALFPQLPTLVRPNGYDPPAGAPAPAKRSDSTTLRIAHFGMLSSYRLDIRPLLQGLSEAGRWERVVFAQFGDDFAGMLDRPPAGVEVERNPSYPWQQVLEHAAECDLAMVVGNLNPDQLPSKAVQYSTLPVPRLAVTRGTPDDALAAYVADKPGWLAVAPDGPAATEAVVEHVGRVWTAEALQPLPSEAWPAVADTVAEFVERCTVGPEGGGR